MLLPKIMVAPNGARRSKADHPMLPITNDEIVSCVVACARCGADGAHLHVRDERGLHCLSAERYRDLLAKMRSVLPGLYVQISTESLGRYTPNEQIQLIKDLEPRAASIAWREIRNTPTMKSVIDFYHWSQLHDVDLQHIFYAPEEFKDFVLTCEKHAFVLSPAKVLFVLGRGATPYTRELHAFLNLMSVHALDLDWSVCAFGLVETDALLYAYNLHGKCRIGFENSLWHSDGNLAKDNAERVAVLARLQQA